MRLLVWGISTPQLIKSVSAGNRNTLPTIIVLNKCACPKSQWEKCGNVLMLRLPLPRFTPICFEEMLAVMNALQPASSAGLAVYDCQTFICSPRTARLPIRIPKASPVRSRFFFFIFIYLILQYGRVMAYSPFYGTSLECALLLTPESRFVKKTDSL